MRKQPNFALIIAFLKHKGIDCSPEKRDKKRMGFTGYNYESYPVTGQPVVSYAKQNYTMDNQTFKFKSYIADIKG